MSRLVEVNLLVVVGKRSLSWKKERTIKGDKIGWTKGSWEKNNLKSF